MKKIIVILLLFIVILNGCKEENIIKQVNNEIKNSNRYHSITRLNRNDIIIGNMLNKNNEKIDGVVLYFKNDKNLLSDNQDNLEKNLIYLNYSFYDFKNQISKEKERISDESEFNKNDLSLDKNKLEEKQLQYNKNMFFEKSFDERPGILIDGDKVKELQQIECKKFENKKWDGFKGSYDLSQETNVVSGLIGTIYLFINKDRNDLIEIYHNEDGTKIIRRSNFGELEVNYFDKNIINVLEIYLKFYEDANIDSIMDNGLI